MSSLLNGVIQMPESTSDGAEAARLFLDHYPENATVGHFYSNMTPAAYEEEMNRVNFNETYFIIDEIVRIASEIDLIFDAGAGSGLMGRKLVGEHGLRPLVGCDASTRFVSHLLETGNYTEVSEVWMGRGVDQFPSTLKNRFNVVGAAGVFLKGHMPAKAIEDCHAALVTNGYLVTAMRSMYWENGQEEGYKDKFDELVADGRLELVNTFTFLRGREGAVGLFAPLESRLLCFRKLR